ncbi:MAG: hypothetical protein AB1305_03450 [Candidatus Hadarchaeota archaeon]
MSGGNLGGISALDVIQSMMREGFSRGDVYDVLTGTGLPGEQVQLMIDRVKADFEGAGLEPRTSRLAAEVERVFRDIFDDFQHNIVLKLDSASRKVELLLAEKGKNRASSKSSRRYSE